MRSIMFLKPSFVKEMPMPGRADFGAARCNKDIMIRVINILYIFIILLRLILLADSAFLCLVFLDEVVVYFS